MQLHELAGSHFIQNHIPLVAIGTDKSYAIGKAPFRGTLISATLVFDVTQTGADTNYNVAKVLNGGQAGAGTTLMASLAFMSGVNGTLLVPKVLTNQAAANLDFAAGDEFIFLSDQSNGNGLEEQAKLVIMEFKAR